VYHKFGTTIVNNAYNSVCLFAVETGNSFSDNFFVLKNLSGCLVDNRFGFNVKSVHKNLPWYKTNRKAWRVLNSEGKVVASGRVRKQEGDSYVIQSNLGNRFVVSGNETLY